MRIPVLPGSPHTPFRIAALSFVMDSMVVPPGSPLAADVACRAGNALAAQAVVVALADLAVGDFATIHAILSTDNDADRDLVMRLVEIGFVPGERVRVIAVGHPGREPIAVRLAATASGRRSMSGSTFAMRRHEAHFIRVVPDAAIAVA